MISLPDQTAGCHFSSLTSLSSADKDGPFVFLHRPSADIFCRRLSTVKKHKEKLLRNFSLEPADTADRKDGRGTFFIGTPLERFKAVYDADLRVPLWLGGCHPSVRDRSNCCVRHSQFFIPELVVGSICFHDVYADGGTPRGDVDIVLSGKMFDGISVRWDDGRISIEIPEDEPFNRSCELVGEGEDRMLISRPFGFIRIGI